MARPISCPASNDKQHALGMGEIYSAFLLMAMLLSVAVLTLITEVILDKVTKLCAKV